MNILFYHPFFDAKQWIEGMRVRLPQANIRQWEKGDNQHADYAMVWLPPYECLAGRKDLKGIFALGAGVDAILKQEQDNPGTLPAGVPLMRLEDTGMAIQMEEYAMAKVLSYFRRMDEYRQLQSQRQWKPLPAYQHEEFVVGIMGAGALGQAVAKRLISFGFHVRTWSRSEKHIDNVKSYYGKDQLPSFLSGTRVIINLLPSTPETVGILNQQLFSQLQPNSYIINLARGAHLIEQDLLSALEIGQVAGASLDVFANEPLSQMHPFWTHPRIAITPHVAAFTKPLEAMDMIASNIKRIEAGQTPEGIVDLIRGY
ncbi:MULTISPECIES: glyoxylate/hydroxypyruvate reductase GhrA [unclassified Providencia]|uniref:glyoxylate/hydroxypyruvate reductase GhrA n=1 Tax=unclassified Providencia TaxID=2633465 RepID=UPI000E87F113|nr:glyoxylate/hydroxypyruvate reductase GhrA [Providencia sp.]MBP6083263.1 glyoxylate/hydroxypyruvate reductase GhrA [Providencia sp.]HBO21810.1 glyoxylate/hydroxypyruvate reductase GhrA [Providencia sp.]